MHQLVDRGELDLHAPVARYGPSWTGGKQAITLMVMATARGDRRAHCWEQVADWDLFASTGCRRNRGGSRVPRLPHDHLQFHLGEVSRRVTGGRNGRSPAYRDR